MRKKLSDDLRFDSPGEVTSTHQITRDGKTMCDDGGAIMLCDKVADLALGSSLAPKMSYPGWTARICLARTGRIAKRIVCSRVSPIDIVACRGICIAANVRLGKK